jgi:lipopolysaccharide export system permease protein
MFDIRGEITNSFVGEGEFVHPSEGITLYVGDTSREGEMAEIFLNDQRDPKQTVTYSAQKALLLHDNSSTRMVMFDGIAQTLDKTNDTLTSIKFSQFVYDLSELIAVRGQRTRSPVEYFLPALLNPTAEMLGTAHFARGDFEAQAHDQLAIPLLTLVFPSLALASVLSGPFRRGGIALRLAVAVFGAAVIQLGTVLAKSFVRTNPDFALVSYLPALVAAMAAAFLLLRAGSTRQFLLKMPGQA